MAEVAPAGTRGECQKVSKVSSRCRLISIWAPLKSLTKGVGTLSNNTKSARARTGGYRDKFSCPPFLLEKYKRKGDEDMEET